MKKKKYWIKYIDAYSKKIELIKYESNNFDDIYELYSAMVDNQTLYVTTAYHLYSVSKSFKDKIETMKNL